MSENLKLWKLVEKTDPAYTKEVSFGRKYTDINATYMFRQATDLFGPCGVGWGFTLGEPDYQHFDTGEVLVRIRVSLWYKQGEVIHQGPTVDGAKFLRAGTKNGLQIDDESYKKAAADGIKKGLSMLGFCADVFLGHFDDPVRSEPSERKTGRATPPRTAPDAQPAGGGNVPVCPDCGSPMRERASKTDGGKFWGCTTYPACKKTLPHGGSSKAPAKPDHEKDGRGDDIEF